MNLYKKAIEIVDNYFKSFNNKPEGYSRTKLVAYAFAAMTMIIEWLWACNSVMRGDWTHLLAVLITNTSIISALLITRAFKKPTLKSEDEKIE